VGLAARPPWFRPPPGARILGGVARKPAAPPGDRAYKISRARRDTILTSATPGDLAAQISQAEHARPGLP
jgi:hypothetical protein